MSLVEYTQDRIDNIVVGIAEVMITLTSISMCLRAASDPGVYKMEEDLIALSVFHDSIRHYDVESKILTQDEINTIIEFCILITEKYDMQFQ
jgi:hypothetical protein